MDITKILTELANQREIAKRAKETREKMLEELYARPGYQNAVAIAEDAAQIITWLEEQLHQAALDAYAANGSKKPFDGLSIKVFTRLRYDPVAALDWARKNLPEALTLDTRLFETHAKGVAKTQPLPCVQIVEEPRAQIAGDLSKYLPVVPKPKDPLTPGKEMILAVLSDDESEPA